MTESAPKRADRCIHGDSPNRGFSKGVNKWRPRSNPPFLAYVTMVFAHFANFWHHKILNIAKIAIPFDKNSTSKFAHACTQPQVGQHAPNRP